MKPALRIVLIEDEPATARQLKFLLQEIDPDIDVLAILGTVQAASEWLSLHRGTFDLLFMDIRLSDGISLEIVEKTRVDVPVIFVTAYNDYALQAFKANGIDYILKPFDENDLQQAISRFRRLTGQGTPAIESSALQQLAAALGKNTGRYKQSFLVHFRDKLIPLTTEDICWFHSRNDTTFAQNTKNQPFVVDFTLEELQDQLDPAQFFRVNRQFIVHRKAIREIDFYFNGRLLLKTTPEADEKMLISKARVPDFKAWMNS